MRYALPILVVALIIPAFFALGQRGFAAFGRWQQALRVLLALMLLGAAMEHLLHPDVFASIIPPAFPYPHQLAILSGVFEAAGAVGLLLPATTRAASLCLAFLMVAVFPANIYVAGRTTGSLHMPVVSVRAVMQMIFIALILFAGWGIPRMRKEKQSGAKSPPL